MVKLFTLFFYYSDHLLDGLYKVFVPNNNIASKEKFIFFLSKINYFHLNVQFKTEVYEVGVISILTFPIVNWKLLKSCCEVYMSLCLSASMSLCLSVFLCFCLSVSLCFCLSAICSSVTQLLFKIYVYSSLTSIRYFNHLYLECC
jgi:hypothetical protein